MRKQTKFVAVLSAAALLAIGASMTSFAASGWTEENGTWVYYDSNGDLATNKWAKSGDHWFYLGDDGEMAVDQLIEDDNNAYYYVDENGAMVTNKWVAVENEDYDGDDSEPVDWWYYFGSNGKAFKGSNNNGVSLKTINGKKYTFDEEGKMLYGWVNSTGDRETGDDAWRNGDYYFGDENDGAMTVGWKYLHITDDQASVQTSGNNTDTAFEDEEQDRWFYFKTNGKKTVSKEGTTINGKKYGFDAFGRMIAEWSQNASYATPANSSAVASPNNALTGARANQWRYYGSPEDGARVTKGWFQVVPAFGLNSGDYNDDSENWYYSDNNGRLVTNEIKTIKGKKYAFKQNGAMISGLKFVSVLKANKNTIVAVHNGDYYDTEEEFNNFSNGLYYDSTETQPNFDETNQAYDYVTYCYYFGEGSDGSMKTGSQSVSIDGDKFSFLFNKSGGTKGAGKTGDDNDKFYLNGKIVKADRDDKYSVVKVTRSISGSTNVIDSIQLLTTDQFVYAGSLGSVLSSDTTASFNGESFTKKKGNAYYTFPSNDPVTGQYDTYYLVNTSGKIEKKNKDVAKDGDGICYQVKGGKIVAVYEQN